MIKYGIDVSKWQGTINWNKVKSSDKADFAILRIGYGNSTVDTKFNSYYSNAKSQGIPLGGYWYNYATTVDGARTEARACIKAMQGKTFEYPIYYDIEEAKTFRTGKVNVSNIAKAFCEELENAGYFVGIYSSKSGLETYLDSDVKNRYTVWVANVGVSKTTYSGNYDVWQYSWKGAIPGITGDVDLDYCYKDFPEIIKKSGKNGFSKDGSIASIDSNLSNSTVTTQPIASTKFNIKVACASLNVRSGPGLSYKVNTVVKKNQIYTIVEEKNGWGKLISGAGWISLSPSYVTRL